MIDLEGETLASAEAGLLRHSAVGGVILFSRNYRRPGQVRGLVAAIRSAAGRPVLVAIDQEGGRVQRMRTGFSALPPARVLGEIHDSDPGLAMELARARGRLLALELHAVGIDFSFAPVVDVDYGRSDVIGDRALHGDPEVVSILGAAFVQGAASAGMACVAKHFPGHGWVEADSHIEMPVDDRDYSPLLADLVPFERLFAAGAGAVMTAHVQYPAVDDPTPCYSRRWMREELRRRMGFSGAIFADDLSMHGAGQAGDLGQRVQAALEAGCDMLPICNDPEGVRELLRDWRFAAQPDSAARLATLRRAA
ncbi:MAG: beta-N-acetylhexosaminidase [Gammaproteobacteria bacterium]|nr:beta-N-acetylhexosaminidase [Gammaproteobacteria bacterium]